MASVDSSAPSGDGRREHGSMVECHLIGDGLCDRSGDRVDLIRSIRWMNGDFDGPDAILGSALASEEKRAMEVDFDLSFTESGNATVVTE
jgi:hypothetical protein